MTKAQAIKDSIAHWKRMIAWAEGQRGSFSWGMMLQSTGEDWYADHCSLCKKYHSDTNEGSCDKCPLYKHVGIGCAEKNHVWAKFTLLLPKRKWINQAKKMLKLLEELL